MRELFWLPSNEGKEEAVAEVLRQLLSELEQFGEQNDSTVTDRPRRMLNITRDTGEFLSVLVRAAGASKPKENPCRLSPTQS